jgi:hypothetical protein
MQRLRETDGTPSHRRAIRFFIARSRRVDTPLHQQLLSESKAVYEDLKAKARATEDAEDDAVEASADADAAEIALENAIRDIDGDLERLDRDHHGLNARSAVFPDGFGAIIDPEGDEQRKILPSLHVRLDPFKNKQGMSTAIAKLTASEAAFDEALGAEVKADAAVDTAFAEEQAARRAVREQLESANELLRNFYKSRPAQAETFFLKLGTKGGKAPPPKGGGDGGGAP